MESAKDVFFKISRIYWRDVNCTEIKFPISFARVWSNLNQMCDLLCFSGEIWWQRSPSYLIKIPWCSALMTSLYPGGQWVSKSCCHHVSVSNIVSTSLIDFMNSLSLSLCLSVCLSVSLIVSFFPAHWGDWVSISADPAQLAPPTYRGDCSCVGGPTLTAADCVSVMSHY